MFLFLKRKLESIKNYKKISISLKNQSDLFIYFFFLKCVKEIPIYFLKKKDGIGKSKKGCFYI